MQSPSLWVNALDPQSDGTQLRQVVEQQKLARKTTRRKTLFFGLYFILVPFFSIVHSFLFYFFLAVFLCIMSIGLAVYAFSSRAADEEGPSPRPEFPATPLPELPDDIVFIGHTSCDTDSISSAIAMVALFGKVHSASSTKHISKINTKNA